MATVSIRWNRRVKEFVGLCSATFFGIVSGVVPFAKGEGGSRWSRRASERKEAEKKRRRRRARRRWEGNGGESRLSRRGQKDWSEIKNSRAGGWGSPFYNLSRDQSCTYTYSFSRCWLAGWLARGRARLSTPKRITRRGYRLAWTCISRRIDATTIMKRYTLDKSLCLSR